MVHGRSTASDDVVDPVYGAHEGRLEDARELLLATLIAAQAAQIEDLRERVARLEQAG
jgi:hypothetical protein